MIIKKSTLKRIRIVLAAAAGVMLLLYLVSEWVLYHRFDRSAPEISFDTEQADVSVSVTEAQLLRGVKAYDAKDGDVTDSIMIESISKMLGNHERIVTYAAFDKDNHVGKAQRRIRYTDYTPPHFSLDGPLVAYSMSAGTEEVLEPLHAQDCIDGDLTDRIVVTDTEISALSADSMLAQYRVQVTNSCGDVAELTLPVRLQLSTSRENAQVELTDYLIYCKAGEELDLGAYLARAEAGGIQYGIWNVQVATELDTAVPGTYTATYTLNTERGSASADLIIVVEE